MAMEGLEALHYFGDFLPLLGAASSQKIAELDETNEVAQLLALASKEAKMSFMDAVLGAITGNSSMDIPEEVALAALWAICNSSESSLGESVFARDIPSDLRQSVIDKLLLVFTKVFPLRCENTLTKDKPPSVGSWNSLCFVWWDFFPRYGGPDESHLREIDLQIIELLGKVLEVDHLACKESALWGLAEWRRFLPVQASAMVEKHAADIPEVLRECAFKVKNGEWWP